MKTDPLNPFREQINQIDDDLLMLLAKRREIAAEIGKIKMQTGRIVKDPQREQQLLSTLVEKAQIYDMDEQYIRALYQLIIDDSVILQQALHSHLKHSIDQSTITVSFLGPKGTYSHLAAQRFLANDTNSIVNIECHNFAEVIQKVEQGKARYGILPIENTSSGSINEVYDLLQHTTVSIIAELALPIEHALLACEESALVDIDTIYSHPQPIQQCSDYIARHPHWQIRYCDSTASAIQQVATLNSTHAAAIGHQQSGDIYQLKVLDSHLANQQQNITRFIVIAANPIEVTENIPAKTTLLIVTKQHAGALVDALMVLRKHHIIMSKLESRPINGNPWQEMFYIDVQENLSSQAMQAALRELPLLTHYVKVLGCYPSEIRKLSHDKYD